jgi:hypothetical protein
LAVASMSAGPGDETDRSRPCGSHPVAKLVPDTPPNQSCEEPLCEVDSIHQSVADEQLRPECSVLGQRIRRSTQDEALDRATMNALQTAEAYWIDPRTGRVVARSIADLRLILDAGGWAGRRRAHFGLLFVCGSPCGSHSYKTARLLSRGDERVRERVARVGAGQVTRPEGRTAQSHPPAFRCACRAHSSASGYALGRLKQHGGATARGLTGTMWDKPAVIRSRFRPVFSAAL